MKTTLLSISLIIGSFVFSADELLLKIKTNLTYNFTELIDKVDLLDKLVNTKADSWAEIEAAFFSARNSFKAVELYIFYLDGEFANDYINGAPLPKIERKVPELIVLAPKGFQILEEEILAKSIVEIRKLSGQLKIRLTEFSQRLNGLNLTHRMVFEATRDGIIRLASLGITGFDTPSGLNTQAESEIALKAIQTNISHYLPLLTSDLRTRINGIFEQSSSFFLVESFDDFNRFGFIKQVVNPLYQLALVAQKSLFIETRGLVTNLRYSTNYEAVNIFDNHFLNADFYVNSAETGNQAKKEALGKLLFYDPILSQNNQRACASCHKPEKGFSDGLPKSLASENDGFLLRNAPGLINSVYSTSFFWDNRANSPEAQVDHVVFNDKEFNTNYTEITEKLASSADYKKLFKEAYPELGSINSYAIVGSLGAFVQSLKSFNSPFDKMIRGEEPVQNESEIVKGFNLFAGKAACATCHFIPSFSGLVPPSFIDMESEVLGIPSVNDRSVAKLDSDLGRYDNGKPTERADFFKHSFKTVTVRNSELTAPYMHNGVFKTLTEVLEFYNVGGGHGWGIAPENTTLPSDSLHLTANEIQQLVIFIHALTDTTAMTSKPASLPKIEGNEMLNRRVVGGLY